MNRDIERYQTRYDTSYGFEAVMVHYRQQLLIERLRVLRPAVVFEVGCGPNLLYMRYLREVGIETDWTIVEPSTVWSAAAEQSKLTGLTVVNGFMEDSVDAVLNVLSRPPDLVICAGVLQEVASAQALPSALPARRLLLAALRRKSQGLVALVVRLKLQQPNPP